MDQRAKFAEATSALRGQNSISLAKVFPHNDVLLVRLEQDDECERRQEHGSDDGIRCDFSKAPRPGREGEILVDVIRRRRGALHAENVATEEAARRLHERGLEKACQSELCGCKKSRQAQGSQDKGGRRRRV